MTQLYKGKWTGNEGELLKDNGSLTSNALLWIRKLDRLTNEQWVKAFEQLESKIVNDVRDGKESWPPTYAEFIGYALSGDESEGGLPGVREAYQEAANNFGSVGRSSWSHMVVYTAAKATGSHMMREKPEKVSFPVFKANYESALARFRNGEKLDAPPALPPPEKKKAPLTPEQRKAAARPHIDKMKELLNDI